mmetsp:Transcript_18273/g.69182  ORF Transcript_18273/g.69182 Transcript_18273/m.69182 type:complete len:215 (-) Transcript_18273:561-1205(-)
MRRLPQRLTRLRLRLRRQGRQGTLPGSPSSRRLRRRRGARARPPPTGRRPSRCLGRPRGGGTSWSRLPPECPAWSVRTWSQAASLTAPREWWRGPRPASTRWPWRRSPVSSWPSGAHQTGCLPRGPLPRSGLTLYATAWPRRAARRLPLRRGSRLRAQGQVVPWRRRPSRRRRQLHQLRATGQPLLQLQWAPQRGPLARPAGAQPAAQARAAAP